MLKAKREKEENEVTYTIDQEKYYKRNMIKKEGTYSWFLHSRNLDVLPFPLDGRRFGFGKEFRS